MPLKILTVGERHLFTSPRKTLCWNQTENLEAQIVTQSFKYSFERHMISIKLVFKKFIIMTDLKSYSKNLLITMILIQ